MNVYEKFKEYFTTLMNVIEKNSHAICNELSDELIVKSCQSLAKEYLNDDYFKYIFVTYLNRVFLVKIILENNGNDANHVFTSSITYMKIIEFELQELASMFDDVEEFRKNFETLQERIEKSLKRN